MSARKAQPGKAKRGDVAVKVDRPLADKARLVASRRGTTMAEYLSDLIRGPIEEDFARAIEEMGAGEE